MSDPRWLVILKRLHALGETGLHFGESVFDRERYAELRTLSEELMSLAGGEPIEVVQTLLRAPREGYATPFVDVRGVVMTSGKVLLVQEKSDGKWALPGGYADVGLSAAQNVVKEIEEEAQLVTRATHLMAVRHKAKHEYHLDARDFYKMLFWCDLEDPSAQPVPGVETQAVGYFAVDDLPELSEARTISKDIDLAQQWLERRPQPAVFD